MEKQVSNKDSSGKEKIMIARNTSGRSVIWDGMANSQNRDNPLPHSGRFTKDGMMAFTEDQLSTLGKPPKGSGIILEPYDESKHGPINRAGE